MTDTEAFATWRSWWANVKVDVFRVRVNDLTLDALPALVAELQGAIATIQAALEVRSRDDHFEWWTRARAALGYTIEKRNIVRAEIMRRQSNVVRESFRRTLDDIDEHLREATKRLDDADYSACKRAVTQARAVIETVRRQQR